MKWPGSEVRPRVAPQPPPPPPPPPVVSVRRLLSPEDRAPRARHVCEPPVVEQTWTVPLDDDEEPVTYTDRAPPPIGTTWECPGCHRVWVTREELQRYANLYVVPGREWVRASRRLARSHRRSLLGSS